jgi:hypothetical protein
MGRTEANEMKQYVQIKNDEKGYPKFFIEGKPFKQLD